MRVALDRVLCLLVLAAYACRPAVALPPPCLPPVATVLGFTNPEDVEWIPSAGTVIVSNGPERDQGGRLMAVPVDGEGRVIGSPRPLFDGTTGPASVESGRCPPPIPGRFSPHGLTSLTLEGRTRLAVVNHEPRPDGVEAIDLFRVIGTGDATALQWERCVPVESRVRGNDVTFRPNGDLIVTNTRPSESNLWFLIGYFGFSTGDVRICRPDDPDPHWRILVPNTSLANGVAVSPDGNSLFVTESSGHLTRYRFDAPTVEPRSVSLDGSPDNLSVTAEGSLLVAVHTDVCAFSACRKHPDDCRSAWTLDEVAPDTLAVTPIVSGGDTIGAVSAAIRIGKRYILGSVWGRVIGTWVPDPEAKGDTHVP